MFKLDLVYRFNNVRQYGRSDAGTVATVVDARHNECSKVAARHDFILSLFFTHCHKVQFRIRVV